jgi:hypothetical protein
MAPPTGVRVGADPCCYTLVEAPGLRHGTSGFTRFARDSTTRFLGIKQNVGVPHCAPHRAIASSSATWFPTVYARTLGLS